MSLVFSKSRQPQIIMTVFCQRLPITCLLGCVSLSLFWLSPWICLGQFKVETCLFPLLPFLQHFIGFSLFSSDFWSVFSPPLLDYFFAEKDRIQVPIKILQFSFDRKKKMSFTSAKDACFRPSIVILVAKPLSCSCHSKVTQQLTERRLSLGLEEDKLMKIDIWFLLL